MERLRVELRSQEALPAENPVELTVRDLSMGRLAMQARTRKFEARDSESSFRLKATPCSANVQATQSQFR